MTAIGWPGRRTGRLAVLLVAVAVTAGACGAPGNRHAGSPARGGRAVGMNLSEHPAGGLGPPGGTRGQARGVARRMLGTLVLPPGSRRTGRQSIRPADVIGSPDLVDLSQFFWVPMPAGDVRNYLTTHRPSGYTVAATGSVGGSAGADSADLVAYALRQVPPGIDQQSQLLMTVRSGPHGGTNLRADAQVVWYPSRSVAEYLRAASVRSVRISAVFARPPGAARSVSVARTFTSTTVIARLTRVLNGLRAAAGGSISCPVPLPRFSVTFTPARGGKPVVVTARGCWGDAVTVAGRKQPFLFDPSSMRIFRVIAPLLGVHQRYW